MSETVPETQQSGWRWGVNRWIILALIILGAVLGFGAFPPARPHIQLPAEVVFTQPFVITNTLIATVLADIVLLFLTFFVIRRALRSGDLVPKGFSGAIEGFIEVLYNLTESTAGKWTKTIFPWFAAITMFVLVANWMELIPGVDSIGVFDEHHVANFEKHCEEVHLFGSEGLIGVLPTDSDGVAECASSVIPYVRAAATDLNFTVGLALIAVVMIQVVGVRALGLSYFEKFIYVRTLFTKPFFGLIDFLVGLFEIVSELSKIISFSFRLFGNIFAGAVLLFVIGTLIPPLAQTGVLLLEVFVGLIQAIVFGMLTMVFMSQATHSHHGDEEHH